MVRGRTKEAARESLAAAIALILADRKSWPIVRPRNKFLAAHFVTDLQIQGYSRTSPFGTDFDNPMPWARVSR